jgi:cell division inhibitor SepF
MATMWRRAMLYLGLGPDEEYEDYEGPEERPAPQPEPAAARPRPAPARAQPSGRSPAPARPPEPRASDPAESSAVRTLPPKGADRGPERSAAAAKPRTSVVRPVPVAPNAKPHVVSPTSFNHAQEVADKFKASQPVIMNLQGVPRDLSRRLIDFASGLCYGVGGQMEKVANSVYLLTPSNVEVSAEERRRLHERGLHDS